MKRLVTTNDFARLRIHGRIEESAYQAHREIERMADKAVEHINRSIGQKVRRTKVRFTKAGAAQGE